LFSILIAQILFCNQIEYRFDGRLSTKSQEDIKKSIQELVTQKKNAAYLTQTIPSAYPCVQSVTIEHLPENKDQINIESVQPHIIICIDNHNYLIDTQGRCLNPDNFRQEECTLLPTAYALKKNIVDHWDAHLAQAIIYFKVIHPDSRIEIDNAHAIRVQPNTGAVIISDAYQLPTQDQLAVCAQQTEQHNTLPAGHLKKCKQLSFDTRFDKQVIQRCIFTGSQSRHSCLLRRSLGEVGLVTADGINIGGTGHGSHTT